MNAYERRIERNKERIMQAALELIKVYGIRKTSINDVAQDAGLSPATVYNHFGSKEDLVRAAVKYFLDGAVADSRKIFEGDLPFLGKLEQILSYKSDMLGQYHGELMQATTSGDPEIRQLMDSMLVEVRQMAINFYEEGKRQGYVNPELPTETILHYSEIISRGIAADLSEDPEHNRKLMQELTPLVLYGILGKPVK